MIEIITWISAIILGPGAVAIFIWFLLDLRNALRLDDGATARSDTTRQR